MRVANLAEISERADVETGLRGVNQLIDFDCTVPLLYPNNAASNRSSFGALESVHRWARSRVSCPIEDID
jgi:hypothetical protein